MPRRDNVERARTVIDRFLTRPLLPLLLAVVGPSTPLSLLASGAVALAAVLVLAAAVAGKWGGCAIAAREVIDDTMFTALVLIAFTTTVMAAPVVRRLVPPRLRRTTS